MNKSTITAVVLTKNEEKHIADCLEGLAWCDKIIVLDCFSTDRTVEIAEELGASIKFRAFTDFADQRNAALEMVSNEWVLFVDADERVSQELAQEIVSVISDGKLDGFWVPTHNFQNGILILNAGLYPDYHLRLFKKNKGHYEPKQKIHEIVILNGKAGYLKNPLVHISCEKWSDFIDHQKNWARKKAQLKFEQGIKPGLHILAGPLLEFIRRYFTLRGYRDGLHGLYLSLIFAYYIYKMYQYLGKLWKSNTPNFSN